MSEPLLKVEGIKTYFLVPSGIVRAVDGVSLDVAKNETVGLVGESGCGKSTLALSITRMIYRPGRIVEGRVMFQNRNIVEMSEEEIAAIRGRLVSMVFQDPMSYLNPVMKVEDQVAEGILAHFGGDRRQALIRAGQVLEAVRLERKVMGMYPHHLSGGMRQRVMIAIALSCRPSLIIADEPTTALDVTTEAQVLTLLRGLTQDFRISLLLVTHNLGIVAETCDKVYVMYAGKIVEKSDVYSFFSHPTHPYSQGLLRGAVGIDESVEDFPVIGGIVPSLIDPPSGCRFHPRCTYAMPICREKEPELRGSSNALVACWLYGQ